MAKKKKVSSKKASPKKPIIGWHVGVVVAMAALVCALPWPPGGADRAFWIRLAAGIVAPALFYLLVRWMMREGYPAFLSALILLSVTAVWMPFGYGWRPWAVLFPLSFALGALLSWWEIKLRNKAKVGFQYLLFAAVAGIGALAALALSILVCVRPVRLGMVPLMSGLLIAAVALGVVLLAVSAFTRRQPWDLVIGIVLYAVVWKLLMFPGFESFL